MLTFCCRQIHIPSQREVLAFIFIFQKVVFLLPPSHKWHHKQTKIMFRISKFKMIEYTLLNVLILKMNIYYCRDKFYERPKFGQYDEVKNDAPVKDNRFFDEILKTDAFLYFTFFSLFKWICTFFSHYYTDERASFIGWNIAVINFARCTKPSQLGIEFYLVVLKRQRVHV